MKSDQDLAAINEGLRTYFSREGMPQLPAGALLRLQIQAVTDLIQRRVSDEVTNRYRELSLEELTSTARLLLQEQVTEKVAAEPKESPEPPKVEEVAPQGETKPKVRRKSKKKG